jgi:hypothetical protein
MSLSDYIKYQRALKGGLTPWEIAEGSGVPAREVHLIEVKHRRMGEDDAILEHLASYFGVPLGELTSRREAYRKRLTYFLEECRRDSMPVELKLESGEIVGGWPEWYSREAIGLKAVAAGNGDSAGEGEGADESDLCVVQRAWIADWRQGGSSEWDVASNKAHEADNADDAD